MNRTTNPVPTAPDDEDDEWFWEWSAKLAAQHCNDCTEPLPVGHEGAMCDSCAAQYAAARALTSRLLAQAARREVVA